MTLDYKKPEGKALFLRLVEGTGVLVENYRPTVLPRAGLGFADLREVNPRLIYAQLSGLGYDGPYAGRGGFDLIAQGMGVETILAGLHRPRRLAGARVKP